MQPVNEMHITVIIKNSINFLSIFIYFPPLSINKFRIVLIHKKRKYCQKTATVGGVLVATIYRHPLSKQAPSYKNMSYRSEG